MRFLIILTILSTIISQANAQQGSITDVRSDSALGTMQKNDHQEGVQSFSNTNEWRNKTQKDFVLPEISAFVSHVALKNITDAEQVFCYTVDKRPKDYSGYTINGFAVTGFCGIINESLQNRITTELFRTPKNIITDKVEDCTIQPKAMIRYIRGVDYTDVLISSPCYSYAVFYASKLKAFNVKPAENFMKSLVTAFENKKTEFVSPSLHKQIAPIGVIKDDKTKAEPEKIPELTEIPKAKGWNNISF